MQSWWGLDRKQIPVCRYSRVQGLQPFDCNASLPRQSISPLAGITTAKQRGLHSAWAWKAAFLFSHSAMLRRRYYVDNQTWQAQLYIQNLPGLRPAYRLCVAVLDKSAVPRTAKGLPRPTHVCDAAAMGADGVMLEDVCAVMCRLHPAHLTCVCPDCVASHRKLHQTCQPHRMLCSLTSHAVPTP